MSKPKKTKKAVKVEHGYCPKCGTRLNYDHGEIQDDFYRYDVNCPNTKCGWYGREDYRMDFTGFWDLKTDKEIVLGVKFMEAIALLGNKRPSKRPKTK
jgi:hypothetical protein